MSSIFSTIGRSLFGGPSTSDSTTTATTDQSQTKSPYAGIIPTLDNYISGLGTTYGSSTPQISGYEQSGLDALQGAAGTAQGALDPAIAENNKTLSGYYLTPDSNPYLAAIGDRVGGQAAATANATFGGAGRGSGGGLQQIYVGQGIGNALTDLYGGEYDKERALMSQAVGQAPGLSNAALQPAQDLISAGQSVSSRPYDVSNNFASILSSIAGLGGTTTGTGTVNTTGQTQGQAQTPGITNSIISKLFPGSV